jgi:hypothetical protein
MAAMERARLRVAERRQLRLEAIDLDALIGAEHPARPWVAD